MDNKIDARLAELKGELEEGKKQLQTLNQRKDELERTLLRISGAIQVLEELKNSEE